MVQFRWEKTWVVSHRWVSPCSRSQTPMLFPTLRGEWTLCLFVVFCPNKVGSQGCSGKMAVFFFPHILFEVKEGSKLQNKNSFKSHVQWPQKTPYLLCQFCQGCLFFFLKNHLNWLLFNTFNFFIVFWRKSVSICLVGEPLRYTIPFDHIPFFFFN